MGGGKPHHVSPPPCRANGAHPDGPDTSECLAALVSRLHRTCTMRSLSATTEGKSGARTKELPVVKSCRRPVTPAP